MASLNSAYFQRRAAEERDAAARANSAEAQMAHLELARLHDEAAAAAACEIIPLKRVSGRR